MTEPASQKKIHDSELALLGAAALLPLDRREEADAATTLAILVAPPVSHDPVVGVGELKALAEEFNRRPAARTEGLKADANQIQAARALDMALVEDLLVEAADHNLANRRVWEMVIDSRKAGSLSTRCLDRLMEFLVTRTAKDYPDYSCQMVMQILPTYEDANRRNGIFLKALDVYRDRLDLQGHLTIAWGEDLAARGEKERAMKVFEQVMTSKTHDVTEVLVKAARRAEELLLADNHRDAAIKMYSQLFADLKKPALDGGFSQSSFYVLGRRLAELLTDAGQRDAALKVQQKIGPTLNSGLQP
jgi:tetratricopeptide (TPR) repeat protein